MRYLRYPLSKHKGNVMAGVKLEIEVPEDLLSILRASRQDLEAEAGRWLALALFKSRRISAGKAAQLAHMSLADFMEFTREQGVVWTDYTDEELERELREARELGRRRRGQRK